MSDSPAALLIDDAGNIVSVKVDGADYRLAVDVAGTVSIGVPGAATEIVAEFLTNGGSEDMVVDGSGTPVDFLFSADPTDDIVVTELRLVLAADALNWNNFGKTNGALPNGVLIDGIVDNGTSVPQFALLKVNEDLVRLPVAGGGGALTEFNASNEDLIAASIVLANTGNPTRLIAGSGDQIRVRIQDNLGFAPRAIQYFTATFYGYKEV